MRGAPARVAADPHVCSRLPVCRIDLDPPHPHAAVCDCRGGRAEAAPPAASGTGTAAGCKSGRSPPAAPGGPAACRFYAAAGRRLYTFEEAPQVLQYNRFIRSGYRAGLSYPRCLRSICEVHNETGG